MDANSLPAFKAYDIRGKVPLDLNLELVRQIGLAYAAEFSPRTVCVGHDMRLSSRDFAMVLMAGLQDGGVDVIDLGLCGTEEVYFSTFSQQFDGGIMVTASHNPKDWNGLKLVGKDAKPISNDTGLLALKKRILAGDLPVAAQRGAGRREEFRDAFIEHLLSYLAPEGASALAPLRIVANGGNGCAWLVLEQLAKHLPCDLIPLYPEPDGTFPHGVPNPLLPENREATSKAVVAHGADFGIAFDGDFDRCFFFDNAGTFIEGYYLVGLLAESLLLGHEGETILHDPRLVWNTQEKVKACGGKAIETKTGHAFIKERMRQENALYGGEMSAHHYFRNFGFCDSGMITWLLVYKLLSAKGQSLASLVQESMKKFPVSGEINRTLADPDAAIAAITKQYGQDAIHVSYIDGVSIEYSDWRCNIRKSNTEPVLRLNVETRGDVALLEQKTQELLAYMV